MSYNLAAPSWGKEELEALQKVIDSGFFTMGPIVSEFERQFASYHKKKHAIMVNSGSSANLISVASLFFKKNNPLKRGDEVLVPALSWATTYHPLQQYGLKVRFIDIELETLNMDPDILREAITEDTRMILGVSILGNPAALDVMREVADENGLYFMEDNCESMDAELNGKKAGTFGDLNTFSFFFSHHISTMEGGMILTDDDELNEVCRSLRAHGWTRDLPADSLLFDKKEDDLFEAYRFILPGYNVRPTELNAAAGIEQLKKLPDFTKARRKNFALFKSLFANDDRFIIQKENGVSSCFCFTIILNPEMKFDRSAIFDALTEAGIGFRIITGGNFLRHDVIKYYDYTEASSIVNANIAHDNGFFVGNHPFDLSAELVKLRKVLDNVAKEVI
ncbi:DegT/DnrJ/EryC1/StrS family aminotransferase [Pseudoalteromonas sp. SYSU M81236]|jgi:CDP-6-deoxy-D-xylo-4-hexulose-3-dehydrase|uniref:DegT/DnrJ/EryC1/StrS family aminotransferase n=1 Tax=Pseudoalteromonas sp. SYSU M81236 TaxID=3447014 RepID=UPI003F0D951B